MKFTTAILFALLGTSGIASANELTGNLRGAPEVAVGEVGLVYLQASVGNLSDEELLGLKEYSIEEVDLRFYKKDHFRDSINDTIMLVVDGGTITFDGSDIVGATGEPKKLLEAAFGPDTFVEGSQDQRDLWCTCGSGGSTVVYGTSANEEPEKKKKKKKKKKKNKKKKKPNNGD